MIGAKQKLRKAGADIPLFHLIMWKTPGKAAYRPATVDFMDVVMHSAEIELLTEEVVVHKTLPLLTTLLVMQGSSVLLVQIFLPLQ